MIVADGSAAPPDAANTYVPSASPGGRAPHAWLGEDRSLYDVFGFEWTLLRLGAGGDRLIAAARRRGLELTVVHAPLADLYEAPLALIRPDQIVAWRGADPADADAILALVTGTRAASCP